MHHDNTAATLPGALGRYEIVGRLAAGGMAEVLLAKLHGPSGFERALVIKRILPHLAEAASFREMFVDEARLCAQIRHPNVVAVEELGLDGKELFLVMDYVEGESLGSLLRRAFTQDQRPDFALCAYVIAEVCAGLHAAHELRGPDGAPREVVHRDVSPQNVVIAYDGAVKLLDFGIAKAAGRVSHTEAGQVKGKFEYMSPEQCRGAELDRRSDVFSVGILLFELTTRTRLFKRDGQMTTMLAVCNDAMPAPHTLIEGYPACLEAICRRALAKDPTARYPDAAAMRVELLAAMTDLGFRGAPEVELGRWMRALFPDRIEEKRRMLSQARAAEPEVHIPEAEIDSHVELPTVVSTATSRSTAAGGGVAASPSGAPTWRRFVAGAGAAVAVLAGVLWVAAGGASRSSAATPSSTPTTQAAPAERRTAEPATAAVTSGTSRALATSPGTSAAPTHHTNGPAPRAVGAGKATAPAPPSQGRSTPVADTPPPPAQPQPPPPAPPPLPPATASSKRTFERFN